MTALAKIGRRLQHGYLNARYGYHLEPASRPGAVIAAIAPSQGSAARRLVRCLPKPPGHPRLLDVGCGSGAWLDQMQWQGWDVLGIDFDAEAVAAANSRDVPAQVASDEDLADFEAESFDAITVHHVLEHSYDPVLTLRRIHRLLRPGGLLWVATPNLDALGHRRFGASWRGLEPPRHLVLFTASGLREALVSVGFDVVGGVRGGWQAPWYYGESASLAEGTADGDTADGHTADGEATAGREGTAVGTATAPSGAVSRGRLRMAALAADLVAAVRPGLSEEASFVARRPASGEPPSADAAISTGH